MERCATCSRVDGEIGNCGRSRVPCPPPTQVDPAKDVVLRCEPCNVTRSFPVALITAGKKLDLEMTCGRDQDHCCAKIIKAK